MLAQDDVENKIKKLTININRITLISTFLFRDYGVGTSHKRTVWSSEPEAMIEPFGEKVALWVMPRWPTKI